MKEFIGEHKNIIPIFYDNDNDTSLLLFPISSNLEGQTIMNVRKDPVIYNYYLRKNIKAEEVKVLKVNGRINLLQRNMLKKVFFYLYYIYNFMSEEMIPCIFSLDSIIIHNHECIWIDDGMKNTSEDIIKAVINTAIPNLLLIELRKLEVLNEDPLCQKLLRYLLTREEDYFVGCIEFLKEDNTLLNKEQFLDSYYYVNVDSSISVYNIFDYPISTADNPFIESLSEYFNLYDIDIHPEYFATIMQINKLDSDPTNGMLFKLQTKRPLDYPDPYYLFVKCLLYYYT